MPDNIKVLIVGAGYMGREYAKVLKALNISFDVFTRTKKTANIFEKEIGVKPIVDDLDGCLNNNSCNYSHVINCVNVESLAAITKTIIESNVLNILVEKPVGISYESVKKVYEYAKKFNANVFVGYNRRYYSSSIRAQEIVNDDGGLLSVNFEFTEWKNKIDFSKYSKDVEEKWLIANSSHVIDLAFYFAGEPEKFHFYSGHNIEPSKDIFVGSGITTNGVYFNYFANWDAPGRWGVELLTNKHRLYLRPMEKLFIQNINSVDITEVKINDELDLDYKPGIYNEVKDFLSPAPSNRLKTIDDQVTSLKYYFEILNGK